MATAQTTENSPRIRAALREGERVTPLELFFDLVFVLAITQCTALMAAQPSWGGVARGLLILGVLWWAWVGYSWLTSVIDPEEDLVKIVVFAAMAAMLVCSLCIPDAFGNRGLLFAGAFAVVRYGQLALFAIASRNDPGLRRSLIGLNVGTTIGVAILTIASFTDGTLQGALWGLALFLDVGEPYVFGSEGWKLSPGHFAERHGLIIIIALGESIVAIGAGATGTVDAGVVVAAILGVVVSAVMWWLYFDVVALVAERRLQNAEVGREQNEIARDSFSYLHFPMVAGIVLLALGLKTTIGHVDEPLKAVHAAAMLGGIALYLTAHVLFRLRNVHRFAWQRPIVAATLLALIPVAEHVDSLVTLAIVSAVMVGLVVYERIHFAPWRAQIREKLVQR
jgi:low temperature requirement protein LtrA